MSRLPAGPPPLGAVPALSDNEFTRFQALIQGEAGIFLSEIKKPLLVGRLGNRLRELGLQSFQAYYKKVREDASERVHMLDRVSTNKTHFLREPAHFEFVERDLVPLWTQGEPRPRRIRAWSAGCSSGEEAYSLAAVLLASLPADWEVEVVATDISTRVLERARAGVWPLKRAEEIPARHLRSYFLRGHGSQDGLMKAGDELRRRVRFERRNLIHPHEAPAGPFDLVFCCNVLIYFDAATRARVLETLLGRLVPGGHLFLGHAESGQWLGARVRSVAPTIYRRLAADEDGR